MDPPGFEPATFSKEPSHALTNLLNPRPQRGRFVSQGGVITGTAFMTHPTGISVDTCAQRYHIYLPYNFMSENKSTAHETKGVYEININNSCTYENMFSWCMIKPISYLISVVVPK